jgi:hypothetical protein
MKIAHIINPVKVTSASELFVAQPITFESIRVAKEFAKEKVNVELFSICYEEDREIIPTYFTQLPNLHRSVLDLGKFSKQKKYPLLIDVLNTLFKASDAEYLIYTNMDIALMPQFYLAVNQILKDGYDALLINRRGISTKYKSIAELPLMYSDYGVPHPGFDCFVFKRELLDKIILENICLGVSFSEIAMVHNFIAFAEKLKLVDDLHLTFHIGTEVMPPLDEEYYWHNRNEYEQKIYPRLKPLLNISKFPYSELSFPKRILKWVLNPSFRTNEVLEMEGKSFGRRWKYKIDSFRFKLLEKL